MSTEIQTITFTNIMGQGRVNQLGGVFINGRPLPQHIRLKIIEMAKNGVKPCHISRQLRVSHGCVSKILYKYAETGSVSPGQIGGNSRSKRALLAVESHIAQFCSQKPKLTAAEIRQMLIEKDICTRANAPTVTLIHKYIRNMQTTRSVRCPPKPTATKLIKYSISDILNDDLSDDPKDLPVTSTNTNCKSRKNRTSYTTEQLDILEAAFKANTYPDHELRLKIAAATNLDVNKIQVWFSNRRARCRKTLASMPMNPFMFCPETSPLLTDMIPVPLAINPAYSIGSPSNTDKGNCSMFKSMLKTY